LNRSWLLYEKDLKVFNDNKAAISRISAENDYRAKRKVEILASMESLVLKPKPTDEQSDLSVLQLQVKPMPAKPSTQGVVEADHCHTCGQPVSPRYREQITKNNEAVEAAWLKECEEVEAFNKGIREQVSAAHAKNEQIKKAYHEIVETNRRTEAARRSLELELAGIVEAEVPVAVPTPPIPAETYDKAHYQKLQAETEAYKQAIAVYSYAKKEFDEAASTIAQIKESIATHEAHVKRLTAIEDGLKRLPEAETKQQIGVFNTESLVFDGNNAFLDGIPLKMLSTGERLSVYEYFCREISLMMPKPHWVLFLDDKDLVSEGTLKRITFKEYLQFQEIKIFVKDQDLTVDIE
jgi:DNA repair exonuclease SbcCD ATPase subunit